MQTNLNINYPSSTVKQNPTFGAIKLNGDAADIIKRVLTPDELVEFREIAARAAKNEYADAIFWGHGAKRLTGRAVTNGKTKIVEVKDFSPRFFEKPLSFIKRVCSNAETMSEKVQQKTKLAAEAEDIINTYCK